MSEMIHTNTLLPKNERYSELFPQIIALMEAEKDPIAALANIGSALHYSFSFLWTGFYFVKDEQLVLGPFQGPVACTRIAYGKGVCGHAWKKNETVIVPDVDKFEGHIACSSKSRSEIVVPFKDPENIVKGVLDIDSENLNNFDETDQYWLEKICNSISKILFGNEDN